MNRPETCYSIDFFEPNSGLNFEHREPNLKTAAPSSAVNKTKGKDHPSARPEPCGGKMERDR